MNKTGQHFNAVLSVSNRDASMRKMLVTYLLLLFAVVPAAAQVSIDSVALRAMQVGRVMQQERVYLHFDNTAYYLGETMWFKAYVSFGADNRPGALSKVLYVELVAPEGYVVETKKYKLDDNGCCNGEFELTPLLLSGYYEVRAYTRYMLNWGKDAVFSRVFPVFDKVNADNWDFKNMLDRRRAFMQNGKWVSNELPDVTLDFYPESGHLVTGLQSRVAFELREEDGLFSEEGIRVYKNDDVLLEAFPQHQGKGVFEFTPEAGAKYHAEALVKNAKGKYKIYTFNLPEIASEGAVMRVEEGDDSVRIEISNNLTGVEELGFTLLHRGTMGFYNKIDAKKRHTCLTFAKNELPEGVNRAVLFLDEDAPVVERQFFVMHDSLYVKSQETVGLRVLANGYHLKNFSASPNEKVSLKVVRKDGKPISAATELSLTVSDAQGRQVTSYSHDIYTYMLLGSEIKGYIPDARQYFDPSNKYRKQHLDLVMLTHGWTSYSWQNLSRKKIENFHLIERGITLKGTFMQKRKNKRLGHLGEVILTPQADNLVRLDVAIDGKSGQMSTFRTDSVGEFVLEFDDFYGRRIASLKPQTLFKNSQNISYVFALDRYYSPGFRLYDYWERHLGAQMSKKESDSLVKLNPFEYMLSSVEVVANKKKEINGRPPHSEIRLNYLDEWEYAQDVTYLNVIDRHKDKLYEAILNEAVSSIDNDTCKNIYGVLYDSVMYENADVINLHKVIGGKDSYNGAIDKYIGNIRYSYSYIYDKDSKDDALDVPVIHIDHKYDDVLTAEDVVRSAIRRHGYHWAYWVQLMVVDGEYSSYAVPKEDKKYLHGTPDVEKMTNFKEFVIRSDENIRAQFENRENRWKPLASMMDNKAPLHKFYGGFLSQMYVYPNNEISGAPEIHAFINSITYGTGVYYPINPNYVACMIPYTPEEHQNTYVPEYTVTGALRYTSVQGYSESKQFYSPDYSRMTPRADDYRRTLLWMPQVEINSNGEALIEFYNSSVCDALVASVEGRDGNVLFSSNDVVETRVEERKEVAPKEKAVEKSEPMMIEESMDSVLMAQCAAEFEIGMIYYNQKRYKNAILIFAELAKFKYPPALYYVGRCYRDATGLAKNDKFANAFFLEAARRNEPRAKSEIAMEIFAGNVAENGLDERVAMQWLKDAVDNEVPHAMYEMARRCFEGDGVARDSVYARYLLEQSATKGVTQAMYRYGMLLVGEGGDGVGFIKEAAEKYHLDAMFYILDYEESIGDYNEAYRFAKRLSVAGYHEGTKRMADYFWAGKGVRRDRKAAKELYRKAANAGNKEAQEFLERL